MEEAPQRRLQHPDRGPDHGTPVAHELGEVRERATKGAAERRGERIRLLLGRAASMKTTCCQLPARTLPGMNHGGERQAAHVNTADGALAQVVREHRLARAVARVLADSARAEDGAVARLQERALELLAGRGRLRLDFGLSG